MAPPKNGPSKISGPDHAERLYKKYKKLDPFPNIPSALLNSADIHDYIEKTGMVEPYDPSFLKSSSYEAQIGNRAFYWDQDGWQRIVELTEEATVRLDPNSLVFFETKQKFRLPYYMAIRFNLRITNVHRGLLLGTGPLVDPGFAGHLLIPIHNLTNNTYSFRGGEEFIWVEFTKISPNSIWDKKYNPSPSQEGKYEPFPEDKIDRKPWQYFSSANNHNPIRNAIPAAIAETRETAKEARSYNRIFTMGGLVSILVAAFGFWSVISDSLDTSNKARDMVGEFQGRFFDFVSKSEIANMKLSEIQRDIMDLEERLSLLEAGKADLGQINFIEGEINRLNGELEKIKEGISGVETQGREN